MYETFNASSSESLDSIFNRLQKIVSQLTILGEIITPEDLNLKFLRSLPTEWGMHVVVWRNKSDLGSISFNDLYNNFKIVEPEVKRSVTSSSNSALKNGLSLRIHLLQDNAAEGLITIEIIEEGNSFKPVAQTAINEDGTSTTTIPGAVTAEHKILKKNDLKA
ncbi:hypothetical protein Tco_0184975 [Tanacetum coccineum]